MCIIFSFYLVHFPLLRQYERIRSSTPPFQRPAGWTPAQPLKQILIEQYGAVELCTDVFIEHAAQEIGCKVKIRIPPSIPKKTDSAPQPPSRVVPERFQSAWNHWVYFPFPFHWPRSQKRTSHTNR